MNKETRLSLDAFEASAMESMVTSAIEAATVFNVVAALETLSQRDAERVEENRQRASDDMNSADAETYQRWLDSLSVEDFIDAISDDIDGRVPEGFIAYQEEKRADGNSNETTA